MGNKGAGIGIAMLVILVLDEAGCYRHSTDSGPSQEEIRERVQRRGCQRLSRGRAP
jgi:hypothetical protein